MPQTVTVVTVSNGPTVTVTDEVLPKPSGGPPLHVFNFEVESGAIPDMPGSPIIREYRLYHPGLPAAVRGLSLGDKQKLLSGTAMPGDQSISRSISEMMPVGHTGPNPKNVLSDAKCSVIMVY